MAEQHPEKTLYTPPESVLAAWTWKAIQLKADGYQYQLYNAETQETVNLLISMEPLFQNAQEIVDSMADLTDVTATLVDAGCCLCSGMTAANMPCMASPVTWVPIILSHWSMQIKRRLRQTNSPHSAVSSGCKSLCS